MMTYDRDCLTLFRMSDAMPQHAVERIFINQNTFCHFVCALSSPSTSPCPRFYHSFPPNSMLSTDVDDGNDDDKFPIKRNNKVIRSRFMRGIRSLCACK